MVWVLMVFTATSFAVESELKRPNILWLTSEDNSVEWIGCYGNERAHTPNIDNLAKQGFRYTNCYANAPVCAPSRSTWITGVHAVAMGTQPMRSRYDIPHQIIPYYPDQLKKAGYYVTNHQKTDFNIGGRDDKDCWTEMTKAANWEKMKQQQPFFVVINSISSHESKAQGSVENTIHDPKDVDLRAYHPDTLDMRKNYAKYHDAVSKMDSEIGESLAKLKAMGLEDNTIVVYCSDHGGVLPRSKRYLYESGIHTPLVIRIPQAYKAWWPNPEVGTTVDDIVSYIDMPKTWLSLTSSPKSEVMQGRVFLGSEKETPRQYHFSFRGRMDERYDNIRAVHDGRFLYIRNYMPWVPNGQKLDYLWKMRATQVWHEEFLAGRTDAIRSRYFLPKMNMIEELYDTVKDPDNITNLAAQPEFESKVAEMKAALGDWQMQIRDSGLLPEGERYQRATSKGMTIYEMVRDNVSYDLRTYLNCSETALEKDPSNATQFVTWLKSKDSGVRYWGLVGLHLLGETVLSYKSDIAMLLKDDSDDVSALAAWAMFHLGDHEVAAQTWISILTRGSAASLAVLNFIDLSELNSPKLFKEISQMKHFEVLKEYEGRLKAMLMDKMKS